MNLKWYYWYFKSAIPEKICDDIEGVNVYECKTEKELLLKWKDLILYHNPDII